MKKNRNLLSGLFVAFLCGVSSPALSAQLIPDQENLVTISSGWSAVHLAPIGQEFVSDHPGLDAVELVLANTDMSSPFPADVTINIREDSIAGPVLGTSLPVNLSFPTAAVVQFLFQSSVHTLPRRTYVIEIVVSPGGGNVGVSGGWTGNYSRGRLILQGEPVPMSDSSDLWLRVGAIRRDRQAQSTSAAGWRHGAPGPLHSLLRLPCGLGRGGVAPQTTVSSNFGGASKCRAKSRWSATRGRGARATNCLIPRFAHSRANSLVPLHVWY